MLGLKSINVLKIVGKGAEVLLLCCLLIQFFHIVFLQSFLSQARPHSTLQEFITCHEMQQWLDVYARKKVVSKPPVLLLLWRP